MIAISQPHDATLKDVCILTNGRLVSLTNSSLVRILELGTRKKLSCLEQKETELALITILVRKEN